MPERWFAHEPTPGLLQTESVAEMSPHPPVALADGLAASALEAFFKLQQNLHHFIAITSYLDREIELPRTGGRAVSREIDRKGFGHRIAISGTLLVFLAPGQCRSHGL
ncbi:hypothetical protein RZS08_01920, partial [Arthrospira platensis SPKY1]|nr:hypothetical protein [Arthrospira platensis SPKY1]